MITIQVQTEANQTRLRKHVYKTIKGARRFAQTQLGRRARLDPDGYAVGKRGDCLFFEGCSFLDLWPPSPKDIAKGIMSRDHEQKLDLLHNLASALAGDEHTEGEDHVLDAIVNAVLGK